MIKIRTSLDAGEKDMTGVMTTCPVCGQKLGEVRYLRGVLILKMKCRRCRNFVNVDIIGNE